MKKRIQRINIKNSSLIIHHLALKIEHSTLKIKE